MWILWALLSRLDHFWAGFLPNAIEEFPNSKQWIVFALSFFARAEVDSLPSFCNPFEQQVYFGCYCFNENLPKSFELSIKLENWGKKPCHHFSRHPISCLFFGNSFFPYLDRSLIVFFFIKEFSSSEGVCEFLPQKNSPFCLHHFFFFQFISSYHSFDFGLQQFTFFAPIFLILECFKIHYCFVWFPWWNKSTYIPRFIDSTYNKSHKNCAESDELC